MHGDIKRERGRQIAHLGHARSSLWVRAARNILIDVLASDSAQQLTELRRQSIARVIVLIVIIRLRGLGRRGARQANLADARDECHDLDAVSDFKVLLSDCTSSDTSCKTSQLAERDKI